MEQQNKITEMAKKNYEESHPWPEQNAWHARTFATIRKVVEEWLEEYSSAGMQILNAGSGGTEYRTQAKLIHLDIVEKFIRHFEDYLVGSVEEIALPNESMDGVICVGSVINYADAQRAISEFSRILKHRGFLILEYERSDSAEFLCTSLHSKYLFSKAYNYNNQTHLLWMYSERHILEMLKYHQFSVKKQARFHSLSSLLYRIGMSEEDAAYYAKFDRVFQPFSRPIAHNQILLAVKDIMPVCDN